MINGIDQPVFKEPVTDPGKSSKKGKFKVILAEGEHGKYYRTIPHNVSSEPNVLQEVFLDGKIKREYTMDQVRENASWDTMFWEHPALPVTKDDRPL